MCLIFHPHALDDEFVVVTAVSSRLHDLKAYQGLLRLAI